MSAKPPKTCPLDGTEYDKKGLCQKGHIHLFSGTPAELAKGFKLDTRKDRK